MEKITCIRDYIDSINEVKSKIKWQDILFRGQGDSSWKIESTLERSGIERISFEDYYMYVEAYKRSINSLGYHFKLGQCDETGKKIDFKDYRDISWNRFPDLSFLSFLRHHGFPTPLVDVTKSEYVALFFACENLKYGKDLESSANTDAKVFVIQGDLWSLGGTECPEFHNIGHYIEANPRHIAQQSEYLIPTYYEAGENRQWHFISFEQSLQYQKQLKDASKESFPSEPDDVYEIVIDGDSKSKILSELAQMNINHYTLYLDEDALVKKLKMDFLREKNLL